MKFKLHDRVSWSIFNLTGTVTNVLSNIVYIKWDEGNHTISYNAFECRNMEVILPVLLIGDRVALKNSSNKGVIISHYDYNSLFVQWDGSSEHFYVSIKDLTRDNSNVATDNKLKVTAEVDTTPIFKVGDRVIDNSKNKGVITRIDKYVEHPYPSDKPYFKWFKWNGGKDILPTKKPKHSGIEITIKWDDINEPYLYTDTLNFHLDTDQVLATKEADTSEFKVGDRVISRDYKGVITSIINHFDYPSNGPYFKLDSGDIILPTKKAKFMRSEIWIKWDGINEPYSYTETLNFHLDTSPVLTTKEADTTPIFKVGDSVLSRDHKYSGVVTNVGFSNCISIKWNHHDSELFYSNTSDINALIPVLTTKEADTTLVFKVDDRIAHKKSSNKGIIICNYTTIYTPTLLAVQWDGSSEYFYISPKDLTLDNTATDYDTVGFPSPVVNEILVEMMSVLLRGKCFKEAKELIDCVEAIVNPK
jgi:hypothetical protein